MRRVGTGLLLCMIAAAPVEAHASTAHLGYRALSQDYESAKPVYDVTLHGPLIGLTLRF